MNTYRYIRYGCFAVIGALTAYLGFSVISWQFWAFMVIGIVLSSASAAEARSSR